MKLYVFVIFVATLVVLNGAMDVDGGPAQSRMDVDGGHDQSRKCRCVEPEACPWDFDDENECCDEDDCIHRKRMFRSETQEFSTETQDMKQTGSAYIENEDDSDLSEDEKWKRWKVRFEDGQRNSMNKANDFRNAFRILSPDRTYEGESEDQKKKKLENGKLAGGCLKKSQLMVIMFWILSNLFASILLIGNRFGSTYNMILGGVKVSDGETFLTMEYMPLNWQDH
jgi:hypothetical protein